MSELIDFHKNFLGKLRSESGTNGTSLNEEFLSEISEILFGAEEIPDDIHYCYYEGNDRSGKRKIQINGYVYNYYDSCLNIYVVPPVSVSDSFESLSLDDIDRYYSRAKLFISESEYIKSTAEESHPAYGLACDISDGFYADLKKYQICIITDNVKTKNYKAQSATSINEIPVEYTIIDIERISQIENSLNGKVPLEINLKDFTEGLGIPCMLANKTDDYQSYLCNIPGLILADLYNTYGSRLLEGNVRSFLQQKNKVNKGIRNTILKEPENFFIYNNGITATADAVEFNDSSALTYVKGLQIVNGGQTTASIAACLLNDKKEGSVEKIKKISVPMKLTVVPYDKAVTIIPNISRYANSQNKVSEADLWSNHPFHIKMEEISRRLITPILNGKTHGTYWYYERARGQYKQSTYKKTESEKKKFEILNPKNQLLTKTDFAKYINIKNLHPEFASLGGEKSFFKIASQINEDWDKHAAVYNESYFQEIVAIAILYKDVDAIVKKQGRDYKANIDAYTVSLLLYLIDNQFPGCHINYKDIWNKQAIKPEIHVQLMTLADYVYEVLTSPNRSVENVTEWAKKEACWNCMKNCEITLDSCIKEFLFSENEYFEAKDEARKQDRNLTSAQAMMEVCKYGSQNWLKLLDWNKESKLLSEKEVSLVTTATMMNIGRFPTEKQCVAIMKILDNARDNGFLL